MVLGKENIMAATNLPFPETLYVSHFDHSSEETPSLNACVRQLDAIDDNEVTHVAEYTLVSVRKLAKRVEEVADGN